MTNVVYHICVEKDWCQSQSSESFLGSTQDQQDGFIHLSTAVQLRRCLSKFFKGCDDAVCLMVNYSSIEDKVKWEVKSDLHPHWYGPLPLSAVVKEQKLVLGDDDIPQQPEWKEFQDIYALLRTLCTR